MAIITDLASQWLYGTPPMASHDPSKSDGMAVFQQIDSIINAYISSGGLIYLDRASLYADLAHTANSMAWVVSDATLNYNGIYMKSGASGDGSWSRVADLPYSIVYAVDSGTGTPNAIIATPTVPISQSSIVVVFALNNSTASGPTISFDGGSTYIPILTSSGTPVVSGGISSGMSLLGRVSSTEFRLISDQASSAVLASAEAIVAAYSVVVPVGSGSVGMWALQAAAVDAGLYLTIDQAIPGPTEASFKTLALPWLVRICFVSPSFLAWLQSDSSASPPGPGLSSSQVNSLLSSASTQVI